MQNNASHYVKDMFAAYHKALSDIEANIGAAFQDAIDLEMHSRRGAIFSTTPLLNTGI